MRTSSATLVLLLALVVLLGNVADATKSTCTSHRVRKEVRDLSAKELKALQDAFNKLNKDGTMAKFTALHKAHKDLSHFNPQFLMFHRAMLKDFEDALVAASNGALTGLPYWDATYDAHDPAKSVVLSPDFMGSAGKQGKSECVSDGPFKGMKNPDGGCLTRCPAEAPWTLDQSLVATIMSLYPTDYVQFEYYLERGPHLIIHNSIGGDMYGLETSSNDPIFYLWHNYIDAMWAKWQLANKDAFYAYGGEANGKTYTKKDKIMSYVAEDLLDFKHNLCYEFQDAKFPKEGIAAYRTIVETTPIASATATSGTTKATTSAVASTTTAAGSAASTATGSAATSATGAASSATATGTATATSGAATNGTATATGKATTSAAATATASASSSVAGYGTVVIAPLPIPTHLNVNVTVTPTGPVVVQPPSAQLPVVYKPLPATFLEHFGIKPEEIKHAETVFTVVSKQLQKVAQQGGELPSYDTVGKKSTQVVTTVVQEVHKTVEKVTTGKCTKVRKCKKYKSAPVATQAAAGY
ncbi:hypothetical protein AMAG_06560 [Allomyces macrogynus ATCC 38327]|uniref:Tyrosinase copper-binding domain-containing protein n=1 Tax=Allomyces macrogynus (strain ATCC 38327) TaxID=578462 RepID=A0A0L0SHB1_ALLM3|nr:hypothetical protein AMAG_06560 [Allomyces macrogynus ATCC 38327]|eukprot:KNE61760.1 hypothetical protein AMAG_06560 [Allomyces macrogynus ATCC 38327]